MPSTFPNGPYLSVVVPVFNEAENVKPLVNRISDALGGMDYEILFVDDGSTDDTIQALRGLSHPGLRILEFRKNYGQSSAMMAGIDYARGTYIATLDGDGQNDPADLPAMLELAEQGGWDLVAGERVNRQDNVLLRKIPSRIANFIIRNAVNVHLRDYGCALRVMRADLAKDLGLYGELHRFLPVLAALEGARITQVPVRHHPRAHGKSKYGLGRTFKVIPDLLFMLFWKRYLQKPMHLFGISGLVLLVIGIGINAYLAVLKIMGQDIWGKPLIILGLLLVLGGIQLITIGIVVEIQMRTYYESQQKRPYKVRRHLEPSKRLIDKQE